VGDTELCFLEINNGIPETQTTGDYVKTG